jgi:hypothetical protein
MSDENSRLEKYMMGLNRPEPPQDRAGKDGDPQISALHQLLMDHGSLGPDDIILDIGSGSGVLATIISTVWKITPPRYIAVDLEHMLEKLALPIAVHNNSQKIEFDHFFKREIPAWLTQPALVVIRNVLHELDIETTATLLGGLNAKLTEGTTIYIQDMQRLPRAERNNAGWDAECFKGVLTNLAMPAHVYSLASHGGTPWFAVKTRSVRQSMPNIEIAEICAEQRRKQKRKMITQITTLNQTYTEQTATDVTILSMELSNIELQLGRHEENLGPGHLATRLDIGEGSIPLNFSSEKQAFSVARDTDDLIREIGLVAALRTKDMIKVSAVIRGARRLVWFAGYSNRLTFETSDNRTALAQAIGRGADFRALLCNPDSAVVSIRAAEPVYPDTEKLIRDIKASLSSAANFYDQVYSTISGKSRGPFGVRLSSSIPPCSYFLIDDLCYVSLYTSRMSGGLAPAFVFRSAEPGRVGFYEILREEFLQAWASAPSAFAIVTS